MNNEVEIRIENNEMLVSNRQIAEHFGKQHKDVLEAIRNLTAENSATRCGSSLPNVFNWVVA